MTPAVFFGIGIGIGAAATGVYWLGRALHHWFNTACARLDDNIHHVLDTDEDDWITDRWDRELRDLIRDSVD